MEYTLACYKLATDGGDGESDEEYLRHLEIKETEGDCEIHGPELQIPDAAKPLKIKKVNIGSKEHPKFSNVGDYWGNETISKVMGMFYSERSYSHVKRRKTI